MPPVQLTLDVAARLEEALRVLPVEERPSTQAQQIYDVLVAHGFDRADILGLAGSLVDLVTSDVSGPASGLD